MIWKRSLFQHYHYVFMFISRVFELTISHVLPCFSLKYTFEFMLQYIDQTSSCVQGLDSLFPSGDWNDAKYALKSTHKNEEVMREPHDKLFSTGHPTSF